MSALFLGLFISVKVRGKSKPMYFPLAIVHTYRMYTEFSLACGIFVICFANFSSMKRNLSAHEKNSYGSKYIKTFIKYRPSPAS